MASTLTAALALGLCTLFQTVASQSATLEVYQTGRYRDSRGCEDLQLNISARTIVTDKNIHLFTNINDISNSSNVMLEIEILVGTVPLNTALKTSSYEIEWRVSPNFAFEDYFLSGDGSKMTFQGQHREKLNVQTIGTNLVTFTPDTWDLTVIDWPSTLSENSLPSGAKAVANVPKLGMTYMAGPQPTTDTYHPNELFAYNFTTGVFTRHEAPSKLWSSASFVPAGEKGMLVMIGGVERSDLATPIAMDEIHVYDIANDKWYLQPTTGRTPPDRAGNCAVVTSSSDGSTHQIHVYGGTRPQDDQFLPLIDDYWVLSVPQFVWTKGPNIEYPRSSASCNLIGNHRMLISAGYVTTTCLTLFQIVDLNTGNVTEEFALDDTSAYQVPEFVSAEIGGGVNGGAVVQASYVSGLKNAWEAPYIFAAQNTTAGDSSDSSSSDKKSTPIGAIVGGSVGGVAAGVLLLGGFLLIRRRKQKKGAAAAAAAAAAVGPLPTTEVRDAGPYDPAIHGGVYSPHRDSVYSTAPPHYGSKSPAPTYTTPGFPDGAIPEVHGESTYHHELDGSDVGTNR